MRMRLMAIGLFGAAALGCRVEGNDTLTIGRDLNLPASGAAESRQVLPLDRTMTAKPPPVTLDRSPWEVARFDVPVDTWRHNRTFVTASWLATTQRETGAYPTPLSSLETSDRNRWSPWREEWITAKNFISDVGQTPWWLYRAAVDEGRPTGGFTTYERARSRPWLGEMLGVPSIQVDGDDRRLPPAEPGVIRRYEPQTEETR